jgi:hypothetical protein
MSQPDLESVSMPSVIAKRPQWNIYTVLLLLALVCLLLGCLFLALEIGRFGFGTHKGVLSAISHNPPQAAGLNI